MPKHTMHHVKAEMKGRMFHPSWPKDRTPEPYTDEMGDIDDWAEDAYDNDVYGSHSVGLSDLAPHSREELYSQLQALTRANGELRRKAGETRDAENSDVMKGLKRRIKNLESDLADEWSKGGNASVELKKERKVSDALRLELAGATQLNVLNLKEIATLERRVRHLEGDDGTPSFEIAIQKIKSLEDVVRSLTADANRMRDLMVRTQGTVGQQGDSGQALRLIILKTIEYLKDGGTMSDRVKIQMATVALCDVVNES